jgi:hypothetical protein
MLELGQPLHFYDADKLGNKLVVRMAEDGEKLTTLDNVERTLTSEDIVIADATHGVGLAGVMGGLETEVEPDTKNIIIESAIFDSVKVHNLGFSCLACMSNDPKHLQNVINFLKVNNKVVCILDGDESGKKLAKYGHEFVKCPDGKDPGDLTETELKILLKKYI